MRTLQRLTHVRRKALAPRSSARANHSKRSGPGAFQRARTWLLRIRFFGIFVLLPVLLCFGVVQWIGLRVAADGLVHASVATERAPALLRVVEVYVRSGDRCARGDPLLRVEAISGSETRAVISAEVERRALRLDFVRAGGSLDGSDAARVSDQLERAEREAQSARFEVTRLLAAKDLLARERAAEHAGIARREAALAMRVPPLEARLLAAKSRKQDGEAEASLVAANAGRSVKLRQEGVLSDREQALVQTTVHQQAGDLALREADVTALSAELAGTQELIVLERAQGESALLLLDAREVELDRRLAAAKATGKAWDDFAARHRALAPTDVGPEELRALELAIIEAELEESRARLAEHDARHGTAIVHARTAGVVDRVMIGLGQIVEAEEELITLLDEHSVRVVAYVDPEDADEIRVGGACSITPSASGSEPIEGEVVNVGRTLLRAPEQVEIDETPYADFRLPVSILVSPRYVHRLRVNERVRVVFARTEGGP